MKLPSLRSLQIFEVVARYESITKAAEELSLTHASVSLQMKKLQEYLQIELFKAEGRNIKLTPQAKDYAKSLSHIFNQLQTATDELYQKNNQQLELQIAMPHLFATHWLWQNLPFFHKKHPEISIRVASPPPRLININLRSINLDMLIYFGNENWSDYTQEKLMDEVVYPMLSSNLINPQYPLSDLRNIIYYPLITTNIESRKNLWQNWFKYHKIPYRADKLKFIKVEDSSQALMAASAGVGIMLSDQIFAKEMLNNKSLIIPTKSKMPTNTYYLVYPRESLKLKKVNYFREWLINHF